MRFSPYCHFRTISNAVRDIFWTVTLIRLKFGSIVAMELVSVLYLKYFNKIHFSKFYGPPRLSRFYRFFEKSVNYHKMTNLNPIRLIVVQTTRINALNAPWQFQPNRINGSKNIAHPVFSQKYKKAVKNANFCPPSEFFFFFWKLKNIFHNIEKKSNAYLFNFEK